MKAKSEAKTKKPPAKKKRAPAKAKAPVPAILDIKVADQPKPGPHRWAPGQSGNPGGLPKGMGEVKKLARQYTQQAIMTLVEIMQDAEKSAPARVSAATALLDRGYGKPVQQLEVGKPGDFSDMSECEIDAFIAQASGQLAHLHADGFAVH